MHGFEYWLFRLSMFTAMFLIQAAIMDAIYETWSDLSLPTQVAAMFGVTGACFAIWLLLLTPCIERCMRRYYWEWVESAAMAFTAWSLSVTVEFVHEAYISTDLNQRVRNLILFALGIGGICVLYYYLRNFHCYSGAKSS